MVKTYEKKATFSHFALRKFSIKGAPNILSSSERQSYVWKSMESCEPL